MNDPFGIEKKKPEKKDTTASGAAIAGAGGVTAATGLVAGGVPGAKSDFTSVLNLKGAEPGSKGAKRVVQNARGALPARKAAPGGILGFRMHAHQGGTAGFKQQADKDAVTGAKNAHEAFKHGRTAGKIDPELKVLKDMSRGRKVANAALIGGGAATAYGVKRARGTEVKKSKKHEDSYNGALTGAGTAGAVISHGATKVLRGQQRKWDKAASDSVDAAGKLVPNIAGREGKRLSMKQMHKHNMKHGFTLGEDGKPKPNKPYPKTSRPSVSDSAIKENPTLLNGTDRLTARKAGALRGAAAQQRHFAEVYGATAKVVRGVRTPSAIVAGAGAGGLVSSKLNEKQKVKKMEFAKKEYSTQRGYNQAKAKKQTKAQNLAVGPGAVGGAIAGYKGVKTVNRGRTASKGAKSAYKGMRELGSTRTGSLKSAARTAPSAFKSPKAGVTGGALLGAYGGYVGGAVGGAIGGAKHSNKKFDRENSVKKNNTTSAFGVDHG